MKLYKSNLSIWWNKGNEFKPTYTDFKTITWEQVPNFTVNWLTETQIQITLGLNDTFDLVKIESPTNDLDQKEKIKYYYLVGIVSKTKLNKVCIFELDIWSTYFLEDRNQTASLNFQKIKSYSNIKYNLQDLITNNTISETATITPVGILLDKVKKVSQPPHTSINWSNLNCSLGYYSNNALCGTLYFVFNTSQDRYVFIPCTTFQTNPLRVNNAAWVDLEGRKSSVFKNVCLSTENKVFKDLAWDNAYQDFFSLIQSTKYNYLNPLYQDNNGQTKWIDIGSLVGAFLGPHISTLKIKNWISIKRENRSLNTQAPYLIKLSHSSVPANITLNGSSDKVYKAWTSGTGNILGDENIYIGFEMTSEGIEIRKPGNEILELWKKGYTIYDNPNLNTYFNANRLNFTDKMVLSSNSNSLELFTEVPYFVSSYFETLRRQKETLDTSYHLQNVNAVSSFIGSIAPSFVPGTATKTISTMEGTRDHFVSPLLSQTVIDRTRKVGRGNRGLIDMKRTNQYIPGQTVSLNSSRKSITETVANIHPALKAIQIGSAAINTGIQLASNYFQRKAFFEDLRNSATVNTTTVSAQSLSNSLLLFSTSDINGWGETSGTLNPTPLVGYELQVNNTWYNLYGYETNFYVDSNNLVDIGKSGKPSIFCLRVPESLEPSFTMKYDTLFSPTIREAIWALLVQGVVIVSKEKLSASLSAQGGANELFNS